MLSAGPSAFVPAAMPMGVGVEQPRAGVSASGCGVKTIRSDNESEMEVAVFPLGGETMKVSTNRAGAFDVRQGFILDLR